MLISFISLLIVVINFKLNLFTLNTLFLIKDLKCSIVTNQVHVISFQILDII